jgi:hypothetical protein
MQIKNAKSVEESVNEFRTVFEQLAGDYKQQFSAIKGNKKWIIFWFGRKYLNWVNFEKILKCGDAPADQKVCFEGPGR